MAKAKKLPSGSWRCQVFSHYEPLFNPDGSPVIDPKTGIQKQKRIYESFTSDDPTTKGKKEVELMAAQFAMNKKARPDDITIMEAIRKYIDSKEAVLSPATIRGYRSLEKSAFSPIAREKIRKINSTTVQVWISDFSRGRSPKTVRNAYTLLKSALEMFAPDIQIKITLPEKRPTNLYTPSDKDIEKLLEHIAGKELEIAVLLAAFGPLRRGEICALTSDDIHGNTISVNKSMVLDANKEWVIKSPKTLSSYREIDMPDFIIKKISEREGRIVKVTPDQITSRFQRAIRFSQLPFFRFHDLRHYSASIMHAIGIPDQYIMERGGWKTDNVMKAVYRNVINTEKEKQNKRFMKHINAMQHDMQHT